MICNSCDTLVEGVPDSEVLKRALDLAIERMSYSADIHYDACHSTYWINQAVEEIENDRT